MPFPLQRVTPMRTVDLGRPIEILLVEDNAADVRLLQEAALKELNLYGIHSPKLASFWLIR